MGTNPKFSIHQMNSPKMWYNQCVFILFWGVEPQSSIPTLHAPSSASYLRGWTWLSSYQLWCSNFAIYGKKKKKNWHCENNCFVFGINCSAPISHNIPTSKLPAQNWFISNDALFFLFNFILLDTNKIARSICYWANWNVRKRGKNTILIKYNIFNCKVYQAFYKCKKLLTRKWFFL